MLFKLPSLLWKWDEGEREWTVRTAFGPAVVREDDEGTWGAFCEDWGDEAVEFATVAGLATEDEAKDCVQRWLDGRLASALVPATEEEILEAAYEIQKKAKDELGKVTRAALAGHFSRKDSPSDRT